MNEKNASSVVLRSLIAVGLFLVGAGIIWWLALIATSSDGAISLGSAERATATVPPTPPAVAVPPVAQPSEGPAAVPRARESITFAEPVLFDDDLGTSSTEFSAVALNEDTNRLLIADDGGQLFEFDLDANGVPVLPHRRSITIELDDTDIEGLAWISGNSYVLAHETTGRLSVIEIGDGHTAVDQTNVRRVVETNVVETNGNGIEGVTHVETLDDVEFIIAIERPPTLTFIDDDGAPVINLPLRLGMTDAADVWASPDGTVWIVSDESRVVVRTEIDDGGSVQELQVLDLVFADGRFEQPEGLVQRRDGTRLYVVGESPGPGQFSLGVWELD